VSADEHYKLGNALGERGNFVEAIGEYRRAIEIDPRFYDAFLELGVALKEIGEASEAIRAFRTAIELRPKSADAWNNLGTALLLKGRHEEASGALLTAIQLRPNYVQAYYNLAIAMTEQGDIARAIGLYRKAIELEPGSSRIHSGLLYTLYFATGMTKGQLIAEHRQWARRHADPLKAGWRSHGNSREAGRRLRIGYVSPEFKVHPVGRFILPLIAGHHREQVEIFCYSAVQSPDELTAEMKRCVSGWRDIQVMSDEAVAELIRADGIDILVDLSMHMGYRLGIFALKPAPIQITYLAYVGTTGLDAVDYRITDPFLDPPGEGSGEDFCEKPLYIPSYWCYGPTIEDAECGPLPSIKNGFVTFGSLNNFRKINPAVRAVWTELLRAVPGSRLMIHAHEGRHREKLLGSFAAAGIASDRISFVGTLPLADYLRQYQSIDIALDTFPYAGGTTTCDALWMGVPVVTLAGDLGVSRSGVSILSNIGMTDLIARTPEEYVRMAADLAGDESRMVRLRGTIREQMKRSPLMDAIGFAAGVETAYRRVWRVWCEQAGAI
jgi:predicted O-linked N-acetylglucosamine transferase (SPINDLY family)